MKIARALVPVPACATAAFATAPREVALQKLTLTSEYWCDGINATARPPPAPFP